MIENNGDHIVGMGTYAEWVRHLGAGRSLSRLSAAEFDQVLEIVRSLDPDLKISGHTDRDCDGGHGLRPFGSRVHINVKRSALLLAAAMVDYKLGLPVASTSLAASTASLKSIAVLDNDDGTFCLYTKVEERNRARKSLAPSDLAISLFGQDCRFPNLGCRHRRNTQCGLQEAEVEKLLTKMEDNGIEIFSL